MIESTTSGSVQIVSTIFTCITAIGVAWIGYLTARAKIKVEAVAAKLETATTATDKKLGEIAEVGKKTHDLTNSAMGAILLRNAQNARDLAISSGKASDAASASQAERDYMDHQAGQLRTDANAAARGAPAHGWISGSLDPELDKARKKARKANTRKRRAARAAK